MTDLWTRDGLTRRIDRCYLVAAGARRPETRQTHLERARHYRALLAALQDRPGSRAPR